jgi:DNA-binding MarR family transcriptional regulator
MRRLTIRQNAVLAAVERRGECTLLDLRCDFPDLAPSMVWRVVESLAGRGLVNRAGDFERAYLGDVTFSAGRLGEGSHDLPV